MKYLYKVMANEQIDENKMKICIDKNVTHTPGKW